MGKEFHLPQKGNQSVVFCLRESEKYMREINKSPFLRGMFEFLSTFKCSRLQEENFEEFRKIYRRRKVEEIISSGYFLACYEPALILYEEAIKREIPAQFVEMININSPLKDILSHCYVELKLNEEWIIVDPTRQETPSEYPSDMVVFSKGKPSKWNSFDEFRETQKGFIKTLRKQKKT